MAEKDNAFRRMLGDRELFLRFARRYLRRDMPDLDPDDEALLLARHIRGYFRAYAAG